MIGEMKSGNIGRLGEDGKRRAVEGPNLTRPAAEKIMGLAREQLWTKACGRAERVLCEVIERYFSAWPL